MSKNKLIIAAAGSGKTSYLVDQAKLIKNENILITTYTEENERQIKLRFNYCIPKNITVQTWFSFLLQNGVRPYQSELNDDLHNKKVGFFLTERPSGFRYRTSTGIPVYWGEQYLLKYYFTEDMRIYSDKISKFIYECNNKTNGNVINRISRLYPNIFIDEIQDLAGWDLEILKLLFDSPTKTLFVGDPRQVTYLTNHPRKYLDYKDGKIKEFIEVEYNQKRKTKNEVEIDEVTLLESHRNNKFICDFSSRLYPEYSSSEPCNCKECRDNDIDHEGIYLIKTDDVSTYLEKYNPIQLRWNTSTEVNYDYRFNNFGQSKGQTYDRVLIYPTEDMKEWIFNNSFRMANQTRAKFYVGITRAKYSVGIVCDYPESFIDTDILKKWVKNP